ncbi:MAG: ATP-binding protein [Polyangiaceae bacterium]
MTTLAPASPFQPSGRFHADLAASMAWEPPRRSSRPRGLLRRIARGLVSPSPELETEAERQNAQLLATLNLVLVPICIQCAVGAWIFVTTDLRFALARSLGLEAALALFAYVVSRSRHLGLAVALSFGLQWMTTITVLFAPENQEPARAFYSAAWLALAILLGLGVADLRRMIALVGVALAEPALAALFDRGGSPHDVAHAAVLLFSVGLLAILINHHRAKAETARGAELEARNAELLALGEHLASRRAELKKSNLALEKALADLQRNQQSLLLSEKMASLGRLTAGIAHEMNSPLAAVRNALAEAGSLVAEYRQSIGCAEVTDHDHREIAADLQASLDLADRAAERAASFVHGIKSRTRDVGAHERAPFDVGATIKDALQVMGHEIARSRSRVRFEEPKEPIQMVGFQFKLTQALQNLVTNALDANALRGGGIVQVRLAREGDEVTISVRDDGPGITNENLPRIFEPLFTTKPVGKGPGLGLTIVHDIVCGDFRGKVSVVSAKGRGAEFTLRLPANDPA